MNKLFKILQSIFARVLYSVLLALCWKQKIVYANFALVKKTIDFKVSANEFYRILLKSLTNTAAEFIFGNRSYRGLPGELCKYPDRIDEMRTNEGRGKNEVFDMTECSHILWRSHERRETRDERKEVTDEMCTNERNVFYISEQSKENIERMRHGGIFLASHYGNYEAIGSWLLQLGVPLKASYAKLKPDFLNRFVEERLRAVNGIKYSTFVNNPRKLLNMLEQGTLFCLVADQDFRKSSAVKSTFLGHRVNCNPLLKFLLRHRPETPVFFCNIKTRDERNCNSTMSRHSHELVVTELCPKSPRGTPEAVQEIYAAYHAELEKLIASQPENWYGFTHRRFKATHKDVYKL